MNKQHKKIDKALVSCLTQACETLKENVNGFVWLTHFANYQKFPASLTIVCVFETDAERQQSLVSGKDLYIESLLIAHLKAANVLLPSLKNRLSFDTEEQCTLHHNGNWARRFRQAS